MRRSQAIPALFLGIALSAAAWVDKDETFVAARRNFWSFKQPQRPDVPASTNPWVRNPVDAFLLESMQAKGLTPSPPVDRDRLLRRVTLDLTGLPPTPAEMDAFRKDRSPNAYEKLVDRLLASQHYGERWALRWLDVVRYADTNGYELDADRPHAWRYRDYVTRSFNNDKPYDRFVKEQLAGDELFPGDQDALIATGFHRAGPIHIVGGNQDEEMNRQEILTEMTGAVGAAFMGLTVGCARCHNHKFDPILQADYYRLQGVLAATDFKDIEIATPAEKAAYEEARKRYDAELKPIKDAIAEIEKPYRERLKAEKRKKLEQRYADVLNVPEKERTPEQKVLAKEANAQINPSWDEVLATIPADEKARRAELRRQMHKIELTAPDPPAAAFAVVNMEKAPQAYILKIGDPKHKIAPVDPGLLKVLVPDGGNLPKAPQGRRAALATWLASADHPLTARVMVNRIWQFRMGTGIVATPNDFGALGSRPTHPKLFDWLATEFMARHWSIKAIDRLIVTSSAYQQAALDDPAKLKIDSANKFYWRANRRRLEGETIRDNVLAVSGLFNPRPGGKPVRVPIEQEVYDLIFTEGEPDNLWPIHPDRSEQYRRSLYLLNKRTVRLPMMTNFDQPDAMTSCPQRPVSTHALQALSLMNSDFMHEQSEAFAQRLTRDCGKNRNCQINRAYQLALARTPKPVETEMARAFLIKGTPLADFCLALLNRNEFVYIP